jgi:hypothetical protein
VKSLIRKGEDGRKGSEITDGDVNRIKILVVPDDEGANVSLPYSMFP